MAGNLKKWIEQEAENESIDAVVIGGKWNDAPFDGYEECPMYEVLSWEQAKPFLDRDHDSGHGSANCPPITAWTASKVIFVGEYDGATGIASVPRNPTDHEPEYN